MTEASSGHVVARILGGDVLAKLSDLGIAVRHVAEHVLQTARVHDARALLKPRPHQQHCQRRQLCRKSSS